MGSVKREVKSHFLRLVYVSFFSERTQCAYAETHPSAHQNTARARRNTADVRWNTPRARPDTPCARWNIACARRNRAGVPPNTPCARWNTACVRPNTVVCSTKHPGRAAEHNARTAAHRACTSVRGLTLCQSLDGARRQRLQPPRTCDRSAGVPAGWPGARLAAEPSNPW